MEKKENIVTEAMNIAEFQTKAICKINYEIF
jgi:hypothetical protein